jgi:hypothetical protein
MQTVSQIENMEVLSAFRYDIFINAIELQVNKATLDWHDVLFKARFEIMDTAETKLLEHATKWTRDANSLNRLQIKLYKANGEVAASCVILGKVSVHMDLGGNDFLKPVIHFEG